jgi:hypothetical protein
VRTALPYLKNPNRLADVIAAIQAMGTYKFYKLTFQDWADRISGDSGQAEYWKQVFQEHPEFFRLDFAREKASLVWRRQYPKRFDVDSEKTLSRDEFYSMSAEQKQRVSRVPLSAEDIRALIDTAINMHARSLEQRKDKRWWLALASAIGGLVGAVVGALIKAK